MFLPDPTPASHRIRLVSQGEDTTGTIVLDFHIIDGSAEAWVSWGAKELTSRPENASSGDNFHLHLAVDAPLLEQVIEPRWQTHPQTPARNEKLRLSPSMRVALESLRRCPFSGPSRELFHGARRNDLLLGFAELIRQRLGPARAWSNLALEARLREAAEILERELENPPSVELLARRVSLSESTLKRGFRDYYGDTVFGHLRRLRARWARALLESGEATVLEASLRVGYSNPSNFAAAFRAEYGMNPKQFQLSLKLGQRGPE